MATVQDLRRAFRQHGRREALHNTGVTDTREAIYGKYNGATYDTTVSYSTGFLWATVWRGMQASHIQVTNPRGFSLTGGDKILVALSSNRGRLIVLQKIESEGP